MRETRSKAGQATKPGNSQSKISKTPSKATKATKAAKNELKPHKASKELSSALMNLSSDRLKRMIKEYCATNEALAKRLELDLLVSRKDVVPYHADIASDNSDNEEEDDEEAEEDEEKDDEEKDEEVEEDSAREKVIEGQPVAVGDDDKVPRYALCKHCLVEFDVTLNRKGDCIWHTGKKEPYWDDDFWADHDENCHGDISSLEDESEFAEGFKWTCCEKLGDGEGCKSTKHLAATPAYAAALRKRKRED